MPPTEQAENQEPSAMMRADPEQPVGRQIIGRPPQSELVATPRKLAVQDKFRTQGSAAEPHVPLKLQDRPKLGEEVVEWEHDEVAAATGKSKTATSPANRPRTANSRSLMQHAKSGRWLIRRGPHPRIIYNP